MRTAASWSKPKNCSPGRGQAPQGAGGQGTARPDHLGKQAIDDDCNQTGQMLAALADLPQATFARRSKWPTARCQRDRAKSTAAWKPCRQPARRRDHRPAPERAALRHAAQHHEGQEEAADTVKPEDLGVDVAPRIKTLKVAEPPKRSAGIKVPDVATLVAKLKNEAKVI